MVPENSPPASTLRALRAMAHPARIRIYEILIELKQATVGQLASKAGIAVGSASYHVQHLGEAGLVREVEDPQGDRRQHWWAPVPGGLRWSPSDFLNSSVGQEVSSATQLALSERRIRRLSHWHLTWHDWPAEWIDATVETDAMLRLTSQELAEMSDELQQVVRRWRQHGEAAADQEEKEEEGSTQRQRIFAFINAFPLTGEE
jgi:DNA-binding transcriptional ArsR family regulator